jgi:hypothetical protein
MPRLFDPGGISEAGLREHVPTLRSFDDAFRAYGPVGFHHLNISGPDSAARVLAVYASWSGLPSVTTQDSLPTGGPALVGREFNPLGRYIRFQFVWTSHGVLLIAAFLAHRKSIKR